MLQNLNSKQIEFKQLGMYDLFYDAISVTRLYRQVCDPIASRHKWRIGHESVATHSQHL
jgi:hypothetical protein